VGFEPTVRKYRYGLVDESISIFRFRNQVKNNTD
jgi:hypothetical protein